MKRLVMMVFLISLVSIIMPGIVSGSVNKPPKVLEILCAGAMRPPIEEMLHKFELETGIHIQISYASASALLQQMKMSPHGDLFIPADKYYTDQAVKDGIVEAPKVFAYLLPVIMVEKGNPCKIRKLTDLTRKDIRVGLVDKRVGAIGRLFIALLEKNHIKLDKINTVYNAPIVGDLANAVKLKAIDAAVVWKPVAMSYTKEADYVTIPRDKNIVVPVSAGIIKTSSRKAHAQKFLTYMTSKAGKAILEKYHYPTTPPITTNKELITKH